jgi:hypothetical protein
MKRKPNNEALGEWPGFWSVARGQISLRQLLLYARMPR